MKMNVLSGGRLRMRKGIFFPDADRTEMLELPVLSFLLRHPQGNVLFDTGCHPSVTLDAEARWGGLAKFMTPIAKPGQDVVTGLGELGIGTGDIDVVICSHFHPDHCGCNSFFREATVICHASELAAAEAPGAEAKGYLPEDWDVGLPTTTIEGEHDMFGDGRIVLVPVPGHTRGSIAALVGLDREGSFLLAADAVPTRDNYEREIVPRNTEDAEAAIGSWNEIRRIEAGGTKVICGHDEAQWQSLKKGAEAYE
jgi:N-acyl homoserine lactone hydrolase